MDAVPLCVIVNLISFESKAERKHHIPSLKKDFFVSFLEGFAMAWSVSITVPIVILCAFGSAIFSGLTLGLLSLDLVQLKLITHQSNQSAEEEKQAALAKRILKIRTDSNYLLVTLLVGNVAVNSAFSILLGELTTRLVGFLISTVVITIFGEIIPQAICTRYGLVIGGFFYPLLVVLEWGLYPVVKPMAMLLNYVLGEDLGTFYSKKQLKALMDIHDKDGHVLTRDEAQILKGGLNFSLLKTRDVMTPIDRIYGLDIDGIFNFSTAATILKEGYSRVPVFDKTKSQCIVGLLFVKDLVLVDPSTEVPIRNILAVFGRQIYAVDSDTRLLSLLSDFKKGETHLAVVRNIITDTDFDPYYEHIGIITLEDVLEEILQDEIRDEFDIREGTSRDRSFIEGSNKEDFAALMMGRIRLFD
ncbi:CBS domain-containing protein, partial [Cardiosporidium cionae]